MKYYLAPMEGITGYVFRNALHGVYGGVDKYFTPFLSPTKCKAMTNRELQDVLPENNRALPLVPQILTCDAQDFLSAQKGLKELGYEEVNLNLGCPSGTVTAKCKGSGFLRMPYELDIFLDEIFEKGCGEISIKTRIGYDSPEEFEDLLSIYNKYPVKELIVHPRTRQEFYKGTAHLETFRMACEKSKNPLCYNGDIFTLKELAAFKESFPETDCIMIGRGIVANPGFVSLMKEGDRACQKAKVQDQRAEETSQTRKSQKLKEFHDILLENYLALNFGEKNVLYKMKELWFYMGHLFEEGEKCIKRIRKANKLYEYNAAVSELFLYHKINEEIDFNFLKK